MLGQAASPAGPHFPIIHLMDAQVLRRWPWELVAVPALLVTRALPETGAGLYLRLLTATACLLIPGSLIARALGQPGVSAALVWSLAALAAASAVMFGVHGSLILALWLYVAIGAAALVVALLRSRPSRRSETDGGARVAIGVALAGIGFGIALWSILGSLEGDGLFHLARIRKLDAFGDLSLRSVDEFADGGLHPGYAFPLWHVFLALVSRLAAVDPGTALLHESSILVPLAFLVAYEAGLAVFRQPWAGVAAVLAQVALSGLAQGSGGAYAIVALPASTARHLLAPAAIAAFFVFVAKPGWASGLTLATASLALTFVHPTYTIFVAVPLVGYAVARPVLARSEVVRGLAALGCIALPAVGVAIWLAPIVEDTASHDPSAAERARGLAHYVGQVDVFSPHSFRLAPEMLGRAGAVAIAALVVVPLAALASRRRWAAYVLGGSVAMLVILLHASLFTPFSDAVSLSQARRAAGFLPLPIAFAGGAAVAARTLSWFALPVALGAGIALELAYPGEFTYALREGGPPIAAWIALLGGAIALVVAAVLGKKGTLDDRGPLAAAVAAAFVLPVAVFGFAHWTTAPFEASPLTPGLVRALDHVPPGSVVFSDDSTSYWVMAAAPVYVASAPPGHVADTKPNRPYERRADAERFGRTGDLQIPGAYRADYVLVRRDRWKRIPALKLPRVYADRRYVLYRQ
jgi:hypothetical protein